MSPLDRLLDIMTTLRNPDHGCPWDCEQTFATIAPYTVEEAYEVADAIDQDDMAALRDELGDLLFQVVFHAQMAREAGHFDFDAVAAAAVAKMLRRHPHVFGEAERRDADQQVEAWEAIKAQERAAKGESSDPVSVLDGVARALPPMTRALKLQRRAARVGFDWSDPADVTAKIAEEAAELRAEIEAKSSADKVEDEMGDLLFACVNLARKLDVDPERALNRTNAKFERRFRAIEDALRDRGSSPENSSLEEMDALWNAAKRAERRTGN